MRLAIRGVPRDRRAISVHRRPRRSRRRRIRAERRTISSISSTAVVVEPVGDAEPVAQRRGQKAGAGGGADQRERRQVEPDRVRARALADHDVDAAVLHRRVEQLLDRPVEPVDLVDEEHVAGLELGQDRGHVRLAVDRRPGHRRAGRAHLGGDDPGQRRLAEPGRARPAARARRARRGALAAARKIASCSLTASWPTNSDSRCGRSVRSSSSSPGASSGSGMRCCLGAHAVPASASRIRSSTGSSSSTSRSAASASPPTCPARPARRARRCGRPAGTTAGRLLGERGQRADLVLEVDHDALGGLPADPGDAREQRVVGRRDRPPDLVGRVAGHDRQRGLGADAGHAQQQLEQLPLVGARRSRTASARPRARSGG